MEGEVIKIIKEWSEGEIMNFIKVWISVIICLCYCYFVVRRVVPKGTPRLLALLPVVCLFLALPLHLHSMHLGGMTAFFIAWLANFKLLMFAFAIGPISDPSLSFPQFVAIACLPIKIKQKEENPPQIKSGPSQNGQIQQNPPTKKARKSPFNYAAKVVLLAMCIRLYDYSEHIHPKVMLFIYCLHIYICLEIMLAAVAALAGALLGSELEPQFNEPYLATSLQDFWGRRWNVMVTRILRPTVYQPALQLSTRVVGRQWAPIPAVLGTFSVSALMHELIFYYLGRVRPTWEITLFFLFHGVLLTVEVAFKKTIGPRWRLPLILSRTLTVGLVLATGLWMFLPQLLKCNADVRAFNEYAAVGAFVKDVRRTLTSQNFSTRIN